MSKKIFGDKVFGDRGPDIHRLQFENDKLGNQIGVTYFYKLQQGHKKMINELLTDFDLGNADVKMLRTLLRVGDYSELDRNRLMELRKIYVEDNQ